MKLAEHYFADVLVEPTFKSDFEDYLSQTGLVELKLKTNDVSYLIETSYMQNAVVKSRANSNSELPFDYGIYHTLGEIEVWMLSIRDKYASYVEILNVSRSYENRTIKLFKIAVSPSVKKKAIWIDAGIHSCEWIGISTVVFMVNEVNYFRLPLYNLIFAVI